MKIIVGLVLMLASQIGSFALCDRDIDLIKDIKDNNCKFLFISLCLIVYGLGMYLFIESIV